MPENKKINFTQEYQNPWNFNEWWLDQRKDVYKQNQKDTGNTQSIEEQLDNLKTIGGPKKSFVVWLNSILDPTFGRYNKEKHQVEYHPAFKDKKIERDPWMWLQFGKTLVHEKAHGLNKGEKTPQWERAEEIIESSDPQGEVYPTIQEIRWRFRLNPSKTVSDQEVKQIKELINQENDIPLIKFIEKHGDHLKDLLNLVADSGQSRVKDIYLAKRGIQLPLYLKRYNYNPQLLLRIFCLCSPPLWVDFELRGGRIWNFKISVDYVSEQPLYKNLPLWVWIWKSKILQQRPVLPF